jgi:hypothetical protein
MKIFAQIFVVFIAGLLLGACYEDPDCISLRNDILGISFKTKSNNAEDTVDIIGINISNSDSIFNASVSASKIYLPLDVNSTQQVIDFNLSTGAYSLVIAYSSQAQFESVECGPRFVLTDLKVSEHNFDSVYVSGTIPLAGTTGTNIVVYSN